MTTLDRSKIKDARLIEAVKRGMLDPKVASRQVDSPLAAKKLRGRARHLRRTARVPVSTVSTPTVRPPSERFLKTIAFTRARVMGWTEKGVPLADVAQNVGTPVSGADRLRFDPETKEVTIACRCGNGHPDGSICSVPEP